MNSVTLTGNLARDPEMTYTPSGTACTKFTLAVNEWDGKKDIVQFFPITSWGATAENISQYCKKGRFLIVSGRVVIERYVSPTVQKALLNRGLPPMEAENLAKREKTNITAFRVEFGPERNSSTGASSSSEFYEEHDFSTPF